MQSSGEISWKHYLPLSDKDPQLYGNYYPYKNNLNGEELYPSGWQSPITYKLSDDKKTITMVFPVQTSTSKKSKKNAFENPVTVVFEKISDSQSQ